jgi:hypothetical protein
MRFMNPCSRLRGMRLGWYVLFGTRVSPQPPRSIESSSSETAMPRPTRAPCRTKAICYYTLSPRDLSKQSASRMQLITECIKPYCFVGMLRT